MDLGKPWHHCVVCNKRFRWVRRWASEREPVTCGKACKMVLVRRGVLPREKTAAVKRSCAKCKKVVWRTPGQLKGKLRVFCSQTCSQEWLRVKSHNLVNRKRMHASAKEVKEKAEAKTSSFLHDGRPRNWRQKVRHCGCGKGYHPAVWTQEKCFGCYVIWMEERRVQKCPGRGTL